MRYFVAPGGTFTLKFLLLSTLLPRSCLSHGDEQVKKIRNIKQDIRVLPLPKTDPSLFSGFVRTTTSNGTSNGTAVAQTRTYWIRIG